MTDSAHYHPDDTLLQRFVGGELPMGINLAVSSHIDQCDKCQRLVPWLSSSAGDIWLHESLEDNKKDATDFSDIFDTIITQTAPAPLVQGLESSNGLPDMSGTVSLRDRSVKLPRLLHRITRGKLDWNEIASGIHQALLDIDTQTKCECIYMDPGARVPSHTHLGNEFMLVLDGTIEDNFGSYGPSDFVVRDQKDHHGQITIEGCICLFVTDAPLIFTEGKARLLNPLNRIRFLLAKRRQ